LKTAVEPEEVTVPDTAPAPEVSVKVLVVRLAEFIGSLKVALTFPPTATPVAPLVGLVATTVGVVAVAAAVVKIQEWLAPRATPRALLAPLVMVAVYVTLLWS
jgi:hypothetical protein